MNRLLPRIGRHRGPDDGSTSISLAMVFPVVLTMVMLVVQASLWWYAREVALTAAREGAEAARSSHAGAGPDPAAGAARARAFLARVGTVIADPRVSAAGSTAEAVRITVTVRAQSLVPGFRGQLITQHVTAPVERFVPQGMRP